MKFNFGFLIIFLVFLLNFQEVHALAITQPMPSNLTLKRGDTIPFKFKIQAITSREDQFCTYSISDLNPLKVGFDKEESLVKAGNVLEVLGTLKVPFNAPIKYYEGKLIVNCKPNTVAIGVSSITQTTEIPFLVKVIKSEETETSYLNYFLPCILVGLIIFLLIWSKFRLGSKEYAKKRRKAG